MAKKKKRRRRSSKAFEKELRKHGFWVMLSNGEFIHRKIISGEIVSEKIA